MFVNLVSILAAALGGLTAGLILVLLSWRIQSKSSKAAAIVIAFVIGFKAAPEVLAVGVEQWIGKPLRSFQFEYAFDAELLEWERKYSGISRFFNDNPGFRDEFRGGLRIGFVDKGLTGLAEVGQSFVRERFDFRFYVIRANEHDLASLAGSLVRILKVLRSRDPELCKFIAYGSIQGKQATLARFKGQLGPELFDDVVLALNNTIVNASSTPVRFDEQKASAELSRAFPSNAPLALGLFPDNLEGNIAVCEDLIAAYDHVLRLPEVESGNVVRLIFVRD